MNQVEDPFVKKVLEKLNYDIIHLMQDIRNKNIIDTITNTTTDGINGMFHRQVKRIAIVMDEIDEMNMVTKVIIH